MFPDGRRVVSGSHDNTLKVWDVATGRCVATQNSMPEGHRDSVRCGVHCTFVMMWFVVGQLCCNISGRAAHRVWVGRQDAQSVGRRDRHMRGDAERALGCALRRPLSFVMICLRRTNRTGGASCLGHYYDAQGVGRGDRQMRGDAGRTLCRVRCGVHCTFVMICLRRRSGALRCFRTGGASCLVSYEYTRSRSGTWRPANAWRRWKGTRNPCVAASAVLL